jgi:DNA-binding CsgD family transcriptional regulator
VPLAEAIRERARPAGGADADLSDRNPGLMLFASGGEKIGANDETQRWLDQLAPEEHGVAGGLPMVVAATLMRARAIALGRDGGSARARLRSASGAWLVCHACCLRGPGGEPGETALMIEAAKTSEVAPIKAQALELSPRERQISELIAHGHGTAEIATRLYLSQHTVRDYVKAAFSKAGVSSRGELVATLFA